MAPKIDKAREYLINQYISALSEGKIPWAKGWVENFHLMENGSTRKTYGGMNQMILSLSAEINGFTDYRWYTFNQAVDSGSQSALFHFKCQHLPIFLPSPFQLL